MTVVVKGEIPGKGRVLGIRVEIAEKVRPRRQSTGQPDTASRQQLFTVDRIAPTVLVTLDTEAGFIPRRVDHVGNFPLLINYRDSGLGVIGAGGDLGFGIITHHRHFQGIAGPESQGGAAGDGIVIPEVRPGTRAG